MTTGMNPCAVPDCHFCMPKTAETLPQASHSAPTKRTDIDPDQVAALFSRLRPYGQAVVWAALQSAARLDGVLKGG